MIMQSLELIFDSRIFSTTLGLNIFSFLYVWSSKTLFYYKRPYRRFYKSSQLFSSSIYI